MALAPSLPLFGVPSSLMRVWSTTRWSRASSMVRAFAMGPLTLSMASWTDMPAKQLMSPSRSSIASWTPVLAPDGTAARPMAPLSSLTSTSTVGLPRESSIHLPLTVLMSVGPAIPGGRWWSIYNVSARVPVTLSSPRRRRRPGPCASLGPWHRRWTRTTLSCRSPGSLQE